jgi:hypothetical protein
MDANGDGIGKYRIYQLLNGTYESMGSWSDGRLRLDVERIRIGLMLSNNTDQPRSVCSVDCERGYYRAYQDQRCCWTCIPCDITTSIIPNDTTCLQCQLGRVPNNNLTICEQMQNRTIEWNSMWAIVPGIFSTVGIACTIVVVYVFIRFVI